MLEVRLLGTFDLKADGVAVSLPSRPAQSLFAYLILNPGISHRREKLAGLFWPEAPEERARASLRHELWRIRKALGTEGGCLKADDLTVAFDSSVEYELDTRALNRLSREASASELIEALSLYRGELLPGFYDDWLVAEREHLQVLFEKQVARLLELLQAEKRWTEMIDWAERWLAMGQNPDAAYRSLMLAYSGLGDRAKVVATYDRCVEALRALGLEPSEEIRSLAQVTAPAATSPRPKGAIQLPTGAVTFLFTDIEGSTRISQKHPDVWEKLRSRHNAILRAAIEAHNGHIFQIVGDAFCAAFNRPAEAVLAALRAQRDLQDEPWGGAPIRVRMGIHTGVADVDQRDYRGYLALSSVQRIMSAGHGGQVLLSQAAVDLLEGDIADGVGLRDLGQHRLKDLLKPQHLYQLVPGDIPCDFPPLKTLELRPHNLPIQLTSFIGRENEMRELADRMRQARLITLTGVGGTGKTRLALQVAADMLQEFQDGAWLTELASVSDASLVPQAIANAMGLKEQPGRPFMEVLKDHLHGKSMLLILDNCEHLIEACAQAVDTLLHAAPNLTVVATSREALDLNGEVTFLVHSLGIPARSAASAEVISQSEAVRLFVDRACAAQPSFKLSDRNASSVGEICARLDGIPLAIELAAARARGMTIEQIAARLDDRFKLLTEGGRTSLPRHRTLQAAIDWSHNLLSDKERILLRRLSVFRGGWTSDAAQAVAAQGDLTAEDVVDLLPRLVEKSLVSLDLSTGRYGMLETVREYALERLKEAGEEVEMRIPHVDYFVSLTESIEVKNLKGEADQFEQAKEQENILSAINWCDTRVDGVEAGLRLIGGVRYNWLFLGQHELGCRLARKFLSKPGAERRNEARRSALLTQAILGFFRGDTEEARPAAEETVAISRELGNRTGEAAGLRWLATLGGCGDHARALQYFEEALAIAKELGLRRMIWAIHNDMAEILRADGDLTRAETLYAEGLDDDSVFAPDDRMIGLSNLAAVQITRGRLAPARRQILELFQVMDQIPYDIKDVAGPLDVCAAFLAAAGDCRHAALLFGADQQEVEDKGLVKFDADRLFIEPLIESTRQALGEADYRAAFEEGRRTPKTEALIEAKAWIEAAPILETEQDGSAA